VFAINAGAEYGSAKRWPAEKFIATAQQVQTQTQCCWVILGGRNDTKLAGEVSAAVPGALNLAGKTSLRELCAVLKSSQVLLTNDTGPMHVAAALGTPVVAIFGSTSPALTAPGLPGDRRHRLLTATVPCSPCYLRECPIDFRCMRGIEVSAAIRAVLDAGLPQP